MVTSPFYPAEAPQDAGLNLTLEPKGESNREYKASLNQGRSPPYLISTPCTSSQFQYKWSAATAFDWQNLPFCSRLYRTGDRHI